MWVVVEYLRRAQPSSEAGSHGIFLIFFFKLRMNDFCLCASRACPGASRGTFAGQSVGRVCCGHQNSIFFQVCGANVAEGTAHILKGFMKFNL